MFQNCFKFTFFFSYIFPSFNFADGMAVVVLPGGRVCFPKLILFY